jgi:hypothetical protein
MQDLGREGGRTRAPLSRRAVALAILTMAAPASASAAPPTAPDFGPNVIIFSPNMPQSQIQATVDAIATQQVSNQFGTQRYALLFQPGTDRIRVVFKSINDLAGRPRARAPIAHQIQSISS